ncbi:ABC transporter ATP-binding protein/permease [bacterium]|nr:ABC transporter ATP-binding protein/permease [bacterium]
MIKLIKEFWRLISGYRKLYFLAGVTLVTATAFQLSFPWLLRIAIDSLTDGTATRKFIIQLALILLGVAAGQSVFTYLKGKLSAAASEGTVCDLRNHLFQHLMRIPFLIHGDFKAGDIIQRATSDIQTLSRFLRVQITEVARTFCLLIGVSILLFTMEPTLALSAIVLLPFIFLFSLLIFSKIRKRFEELDETEAHLSSIVQEYLTGVRVVKAFAREEFESQRFNKANSELVNQDIKMSNLHSMFWPTSDFLCMLQVVIVLYIGGMKALSGDISIGTFVAFNSYVMFLIWPIRHIGRLLGEMGRASVSLKRIKEIMDQPEEDMSAGLAGIGKPFKGSVYFKHVSFGYDDTPFLRDINFRVKPGKTVAILGSTGSGKTTLMQLLLRFYDDYTGTIYVDGRDITEIPKEELRAQIGVVLQEAFLFSRTIYDNIGFGVDKPERLVVKSAAVTAAVDKFVRDFPKRYKTLVGERGVTLSGGQKQRIALARVLLKKPSILILDDTTSALDTETEAEIWSALRKNLSGCTAFIITHRLSTAAGANKIIVLDHGKIIQQGNHKELLRRPGHYRNLHEQQQARQEALSKESKHGKTARKKLR